MADQISPVILWLRRDLRLSDHPALDAACSSGRPVIPVFILDEVTEAIGAAPKWRLGLGIGHLAKRLEDKSSRLILRRGKARDVLRDLIEDTGAGAVYWSRLYDPDCMARDKSIKQALNDDGIEAKSFRGHLLFEPWEVETGTGGFYKVFTPMWKNVRDRTVPEPLRAPAKIPAPSKWPASDELEGWALGAAMNRGADVMRAHIRLGEEAAMDRLDYFIDAKVADYADQRDFPARDGTSTLSEPLTYGEISPARCWHAALRAEHGGDAAGAVTFRKELVWREFAYHLMYHTPRLTTGNWREDWDAFPWTTDERRAEVRAWKEGRTGIPIVDAGMRELQVTGRMHNRVRMIVASYLTKHLMCHWKIGQDWFADQLVDWDPASNALGWQWVAGSGPDAAPYFRVFNPLTQAEKFDPKAHYRTAWIAEGQDDPPDTALAYFDAIPQRWARAASDAYPDPVVTHEAGRKAALSAYENREF
ncbi:MAG: deoxyribodipyrimidine photolyase [Pseudooceanicola sp.]|nr:deoxyribodipyrimidine photolyase [Pseudooceanicola sp.]